MAEFCNITIITDCPDLPATRMVIVIEYDAGPDMQQALTDAMTQIKEGADRLDPDHVKAVHVHVAIKESAERVMAVFRKDGHDG